MNDIQSILRPQPKPLSSDRFFETHVAFEASSTQQDQLRDRLAERRLPAQASILSIGCGCGILDAPLARRIAAGRRLRYVGLDPNPLHCRDFADRFADVAPTVDREVITSPFEGFTTSERFDVVLFVHSHYYLEDVPRALARATAVLRPSGALVVAAAPRGHLNRLAELFWPDRPADNVWFSEALCRHFEACGIDRPPQRIEARLDVTACFTGSDHGAKIRDFVVHADTRRLPERVRAHIDGALWAMGREEPDGRWTVPHPVDLFDIPASAAPNLRKGITANEFRPLGGSKEDHGDSLGETVPTLS